MGFAAARTTSLRLIPNIVVLPYRNPFLVAKSGATLDLLSGGRFTLAAGWATSNASSPPWASTTTNGRAVRRGARSDPRGVDHRRPVLRRPAFHRPRDHRAPAAGESAASTDLDRRQHRAARQRVVKHGDGWCPFPPRRRWPRPPARRPSIRSSGLPPASTICAAAWTQPTGIGRQSTWCSATSTAAARQATTSTPTPI
ncbi:luciferase-like monooxygenase family protein [Mycobacterium xenopi 3993]|nr:luciferase-like monooxygenase family protein [Mycobacterium xenopi 3993]